MPTDNFEKLFTLDDDDKQELNSLSQRVPGIVFVRVMDASGYVSYPYFSAQFYNLTGYSPDDITVSADGSLAILHWADRDEHIKNLRQSARHLTTLEEKYRIVTKSGSVVWFKGRSRPQLGKDGSVTWQGVLLNETDYRRTEAQLDTVLEHLREGLVMVDELGQVTMANDAALQLFGCDSSTLCSEHLPETFPDLFAPCKKGISFADVLLKTKPYPFETRGIRANGSEVVVELSVSQVREEGHLSFILVVRDVTHLADIRQSLELTEDKFNSIAASFPGMLYTRESDKNGDFSFTYVSEGCRDIFGCSPEQFIKDPSILPNAVTKQEYGDFKQRNKNPAPYEGDVLIKDIHGNEKWVHVRVNPKLCENGKTVWHGMILDAHARVTAMEQLKFMAYHDPVTKVLNRRGLLRDFTKKLEQIGDKQVSLAIMSVGPDRFGLVNAMAGHAVGDRVLETICHRLANCAGKNDLAGRIGGDRFVLILECENNADELNSYLHKVRNVFTRPIVVDEQEFDISVGIGLAMYPNDGENAKDLIENSDAALDEAKRSSFNGYCRYSMGIRQLLVNRIDTLKKLRKAIENNEIIAHYQPQVDIHTGKITGMEALARWQTEDGMVAPAVFIPIAEEYGLIDDISMAVLRDACQWGQRCVDDGLEPVTLAVNISARQFHNERRLFNMIEKTLESTGFDPEYLELELTESSAMGNPEKAVQVINKLRQLGVSCAIDDFGTGYSSLSALKRFPISKLKIDRSFVTDISDDPNDAAIVKATIAMARALNLHVLAEGVETTTHFEFLKDLDCDSIQGYLFSRPLAPEKAKLTLANWDAKRAVKGQPGVNTH